MERAFVRSRELNEARRADSEPCHRGGLSEGVARLHVIQGAVDPERREAGAACAREAIAVFDEKLVRLDAQVREFTGEFGVQARGVGVHMALTRREHALRLEWRDGAAPANRGLEAFPAAPDPGTRPTSAAPFRQYSACCTKCGYMQVASIVSR